MGAFTWGIGFNAWVQTFSSPPLDAFFRAVTLAGSEEFYLILLPLVYWCFDKRTGARLVLLFLLSTYVGSGLKGLFATPRPFQLAPDRVRAIVHAAGYGFPSGHAQGAATVWGYLSARRRRWFWIAGVGVPLSVGLSRMYLGVHFPADVLGGWAVGAGCVALCLWVAPAAARWYAGAGLSLRLALPVIIPLVLAVVHPEEHAVKAMAVLMGAGAGLALETRYVCFSAGGPWWKRALRFLLGAGMLLAAYLGLKAAFPGAEEVGRVLAAVFSVLRYGLIGLWAAFAGPWVFVKAHLAETEASVRKQVLTAARPLRRR